jgi:cytochrome c peroxidase
MWNKCVAYKRGLTLFSEIMFDDDVKSNCSTCTNRNRTPAAQPVIGVFNNNKIITWKYKTQSGNLKKTTVLNTHTRKVICLYKRTLRSQNDGRTY